MYPMHIKRRTILLDIKLLHFSSLGIFMRCRYLWSFPVSGQMTDFIIHGWRVRFPVAWSITAHYSPSGITRGTDWMGVEVGSLMVSTWFSMRCCHCRQLACVLVSQLRSPLCSGVLQGALLRIIWCDVEWALGWKSWCSSGLEWYVALWVHPQRWYKGCLYSYSWGIYPERWRGGASDVAALQFLVVALIEGRKCWKSQRAVLGLMYNCLLELWGGYWGLGSLGHVWIQMMRVLPHPLMLNLLIGGLFGRTLWCQILFNLLSWGCRMLVSCNVALPA